MTAKTFGIIGTLASIIGLVIAIFGAVLNAPTFALASLIVVEAIFFGGLFLLFYRRNKTRYPMPFEIEFSHHTYRVKSEKEYEYGVVRCITSRRQFLDRYPIKTWWSGRGTFKLVDSLGKQKFGRLHQDADTGLIEVDYRIDPPLRFGETRVIAYQFELKDTAKVAHPHLSPKIRTPTQLMILEVITEEGKSGKDALLSLSDTPDKSSSFVEVQKVPYDNVRQSYRVLVPTPRVGFTYKLEWQGAHQQSAEPQR